MMAIRRPGVFTPEQQELLHTQLVALANEWAQAWLPGEVDLQLSFNQQLFAELAANTNPSSRHDCSWLLPDVAVALDTVRNYLCQLAAINPVRISKEAAKSNAQKTSEEFAQAMATDLLKRFVPVNAEERQVVTEMRIKLNTTQWVVRLHDKQIQAFLPALQVSALPALHLLDALNEQTVTFALTVNSLSLPISQIKALQPGMVLALEQSLEATWKLALPGMQLEGYLVASGEEKALYLEQIQKVNK
jgi:hypothetical protein